MNRILQLIPADSWSAVFVAHSSNPEKPEVYTVSLCSWALVEQEDAGETFCSIVGYGATNVIHTVDDYPDFMGYVHQSDVKGPEKYSEDAARYVRHLEKRREKPAG
jgi:hypothetical protein